MKTCKTCKWWGSYHIEGIGQCTAVVEYDMWTPSGEGRKIVPAYFGVSSDEGAVVETGPDFGCVHHEPKG